MNSTLELEGAAVAKVLEPVLRGLPPEVARQIAELRAVPELQARIDELASRCNADIDLRPAQRADHLLRPLSVQVAELERAAIGAALAATAGNKFAAAKMLGIARATLYGRLGENVQK